MGYNSVADITVCLHSLSRGCFPNSTNRANFRQNLTLQQFKVIDLGVNRKPMYDFLLVTNSNFGRICYRFRDIDARTWKIADFTNPSRL